MTSSRFDKDNDDNQSSSSSRNTGHTTIRPPNIGNNQKERSIDSIKHLYEIHVPFVFDSFERKLVKNQVVYVDRDLGVILAMVDEGEVVPLQLHGIRDVEVDKIEMGLGTVLLPGFVDVHVHLFLHPYSETSWEDQVTRESLAERTVRATAHARKTLQAGFTTVRDLGTEGAFDADIGLRKCLAGRKPIIPGPRYYCSTRAIVATGSYGPKNRLYPAQDGVDGVMGATPVDGVDACVREVRRQIGAGADWIKIYADYSPRSLLAPVSPTLASSVIQTFNADELKAMIDAAHQWNAKVAVHASSPKSINVLMDLVNETGGGPDSVEHGHMMSLEYGADGIPPSNVPALERLARAGNQTTWVPTLAVYYAMMQNTGTKQAKERWEMCQRTFKTALSLSLNATGVIRQKENRGEHGPARTSDTHSQRQTQLRMDNIAVGGDTGTFPHGDNALEMALMRQLGAPWEDVLTWATLGGWKCLRGMEWDGITGEERIRRLESAAWSAFYRLCGVKFEEDIVEKETEEDGDPDERPELDRGVPFGAIRPGWAADLIVIQGKLDGAPNEFEKGLFKGVNFVMKGGVVYKREGKEVHHFD